MKKENLHDELASYEEKVRYYEEKINETNSIIDGIKEEIEKNEGGTNGTKKRRFK